MELLIGNGRTTILIAKRNSGKSFLLRHLVNCEIETFDKIFVISGTESINHFYVNSGLVDPKCCFDNYDENWTAKLMELMGKCNGTKPEDEKKHVLLIYDDIIGNTDLHHASPSLKSLFIKGRHYKISILITTQHLTSIPPICRTNCDAIVCGKLNNASINILSNEFISGDITNKDFLKMYNKNTNNYNFVVIQNNSTTDGKLDSIYGVIKTPEEEMKTEKVKQKKRKVENTIWGALFSSKHKKKVTIIPKIIKSAFDS